MIKWSRVANIFITGICLVKSKWKPQSFAVLDIFCNDFFLFSNSCRRKYLTNWRTTNKKLIRQHGIYYIVGTCDPDGRLAFVTAWCLLGLKTLPYRSPVLQANFYTCKWCVQHSSLHSVYESWTEESQDLRLLAVLIYNFRFHLGSQTAAFVYDSQAFLEFIFF